MENPAGRPGGWIVGDIGLCFGVADHDDQPMVGERSPFRGVLMESNRQFRGHVEKQRQQAGSSCCG